MSKVTSYAPATPCWVDLAAKDIDASASFYEGLLGWRAVEMPNSAEMGGYRRATYEGDDVAGLMPQMQPGQPQMWNTYISVEDAEATAAKVSELGGAVLAPPMDVMDLGKMAVFTDPTGAVLGVWQPGTFVGAAASTVPGQSAGTSSGPATSRARKRSTASSSAGPSPNTRSSAPREAPAPTPTSSGSSTATRSAG
jgi:hypothetical protein